MRMARKCNRVLPPTFQLMSSRPVQPHITCITHTRRNSLKNQNFLCRNMLPLFLRILFQAENLFARNMLVLLFLQILSLPAIQASSSDCDRGIYVALLPLSNYPPAESLCSAQFPPPENTVTVTAGHLQRRRTASASSVSVAAGDGSPSLWSSLVLQPKSILETFCSCIETSRTITVWHYNSGENKRSNESLTY